MKWRSREEYVRELLSLAEQEGIKIFGCFRPRVSPHPSGRAGIRKAIKEWFDAFGNHPAFAGLEFDEISFPCGWCRECRQEFRKYLKRKYTKKELVRLGILSEKPEEAALDQIADQAEGNDALPGDLAEKPPSAVDVPPSGPVYTIDALFPPGPEDRWKNPVLWMEHREFIADMFEQGCKDAFDYAHSIKKDAIMLPLLAFGPILNAPFSSSLARTSALGDMIAVDPYWDGIPEEAFYCDLMRSNARGLR